MDSTKNRDPVPAPGMRNLLEQRLRTRWTSLVTTASKCKFFDRADLEFLPIILSSLIATLIIFNGMWENRQSRLSESRETRTTTSLINAVGRQRLLANQISMEMGQLLDQKLSPSERRQVQSELRANLKLINSQHQSILSKLINDLHKSASHRWIARITPVLEQFTRDAKAVLQAPNPATRTVNDTLNLERRIVSSADSLNLELITQSSSWQRSQHLAQSQRDIWGAAAALTLVIGVAIPTLLRLRSQNAVLRSQRRELARQAEDLKQTGDRLEAAITGTSDGLWDWQIGTEKVWYSPRFWTLLGYPQEGPFPAEEAESFRRHLHPEDQELERLALTNHLMSGQPYDIEFRMLSLSGEYRWFRSRGASIPNSQGRPRRMSGSIQDITDSRRSKEQLKRLALVASRTTNAVILTDDLGRTEWINEGFTRLSGYTLEEITGKTPGSVLQGQESDRHVIDEMRSAIRSTQGFEADIVNYSKTGEKYWVNIKADPLFGSSGKLEGFIAIQSDITARKEAENALRDSHDYLRQMLDGLPVAAYTCDADGLITYYNPRAELMWGRAPQLCDPQDRYCGSIEIQDKFGQVIPHSQCGMSKAIAENITIYGLEFVVVRSDGTRRDILAHVNPLYASDGCITGAINVMIDITERLHMERSLRETSADLEVYRKIIDRHAIVSETDTAGAIRHVNEMFCELSGYSRDELIGKTHHSINSGHQPMTFWKGVLASIDEYGLWQGEICNRNKLGHQIWVNVSIAPLQNSQGELRGYFAVGADITSLKQAQEQAEAANRSKTEFLANMSHEIRTPLTAILGYSDLLREDPELANSPTRRNEVVETIRTAGHHLLTLINDVLDLSKIEAGKLRIEYLDFSLLDILREMNSLFRPRVVNKGVTLNFEFGNPIPEFIHTDPTRLRQILMNLIGNAAKFTQDGEVNVNASFTPIGQHGRLRIDIVDTGPGMNSRHAKEIFRPFSQGDSAVTRKHGGTGLGLAISRRLARLLEGDVTLEWSAEGEGTCFRVEIPCLLGEGTPILEKFTSSHAPVIDLPAPEPQKLAGRILFAEDGPDNQRLISFLLRKAGAEVEVAENGKVALDMLLAATADGNPYDMLLSDMQMPVMDGYALTQTLRKMDIDMPIVALTAHMLPEYLARCEAAGCNGFIGKPVDRQKLIESCRYWMSRSEKTTPPLDIVDEGRGGSEP